MLILHDIDKVPYLVLFAITLPKMLSAIAARKAAQAVTRENAEPPNRVSEEAPQDLNTDQENGVTRIEQESRIRLGAKRKPKARIASDERRKKKQRYFTERQDVLQHIVAVESEDESMSSSDAIDEDVGMVEDKSLVADPPVQRPWSPSVPLRDSSDEEPMDEDVIPADVPAMHTLTTFKPMLDQNVFHLSKDELAVLNLGPVQGTLLILSADETICIAGAYALTLLQGTVSLLGTKLEASPKRHHVYAPKSSPVPVIETLSSEPSVLSVDELHRLGLHDTSGTFILIQELRTGIQGLGRVCKIFSGVFDFSLYESEDGNDKVLNVTGAYMVAAFPVLFM